MGWLVAGGLLLVAFLFKGRGQGQVAPAPEIPRVPSPAPDGPVVITTDDASHDGGAVAPASEDATNEILISPELIPPSLLAIVQQGSSTSNVELERAVEEARQLNRPDLERYFRGRLKARQAYERAQREGLAPPSPREIPIPAQRVATDALPTARASREELLRLATRVADNLRRSEHRAYDRTLVRAFQQKAGLSADGDYGQRTAQALGYYGRLPAGQVPAPQY